MMSMTLAQATTLEHELEALDPPPQVLRAGKTIITLAAAGSRVPHDLVQYVQSWMSKRGEQNRYGK